RRRRVRASRRRQPRKRNESRGTPGSLPSRSSAPRARGTHHRIVGRRPAAPRALIRGLRPAPRRGPRTRKPGRRNADVGRPHPLRFPIALSVCEHAGVSDAELPDFVAVLTDRVWYLTRSGRDMWCRPPHGFFFTSSEAARAFAAAIGTKLD